MMSWSPDGSGPCPLVSDVLVKIQPPPLEIVETTCTDEMLGAVALAAGWIVSGFDRASAVPEVRSTIELARVKLSPEPIAWVVTWIVIEVESDDNVQCAVVVSSTAPLLL